MTRTRTYKRNKLNKIEERGRRKKEKETIDVEEEERRNETTDSIPLKSRFPFFRLSAW
jgi:hypothetical protein